MTMRSASLSVALVLCGFACFGMSLGCQSKEVEAKPSLELERTPRERKAVPKADPDRPASPGAVGQGAPELTEAEKIEQMLTTLAASDAVFIRNGSEYSGHDAADHLRAKLRNAGGKITSARQFIDQLASKSSMSGKPYKVRVSRGDVIESRAWFAGLLAEIESAPQR